MQTQYPPTAHYQHPQLGTYKSADELLSDERLSETEKQMAIEAWRVQLEHGIYEDAETAAYRAAIKSLKGAAERLAAGGH